MEEQKQKKNLKGLKGLIEFLNGTKGRPLVKSVIEALYGDKNSDLKKIKIDKLDEFFDIEYKIIEAILSPSFKEELKNDNIITEFSDAKNELENLKNNGKQIQNELSSLIIPSIDMGVILENLTTNCKIDSVGFRNGQKENANFISICRIINRLIDNEYNYGVSVKAFVLCREDEQERCRNVSSFLGIFKYNSYEVFWKYVAKISGIQLYVSRLCNSDNKFKFKNKECQQLRRRFLDYNKARKNIAEVEKINERRLIFRVNPKLKIEDGMLCLIDIEKVYDEKSKHKEPFSFWKIILLLAIVLAFGGTGFFGANACLTFIVFITNFWSIIITIVALIALSILLVVAHKTGAFKVGKLFCSGKYENDSWFYLRQGKEHENESEISKDNSEMEITDRELS